MNTYKIRAGLTPAGSFPTQVFDPDGPWPEGVFWRPDTGYVAVQLVVQDVSKGSVLVTMPSGQLVAFTREAFDRTFAPECDFTEDGCK